MEGAAREFCEEYVVCSIDSAHKVAGLASTGGCVIFDEAHMLGESSTRRTKACHAVRPCFDYGLCLTGTLLHGGVHKALSVLDLAIPGAALFARHWGAGEFFNCLVRKRLGSRVVTSLEKPTGENRRRFLAYLSRHVISMNADTPEVRATFQLPEQHIYDVKLGEPWRSLEDEAVAIITARAEAGDPLPHVSAIAHHLAAAHAEAKADWVLEHIEDEPAVIFGCYLATLDLMEKRLAAAGILYVRVDGGVTGRQRADAQARFQSGSVQVFLGQTTAASTAMDLFRAHYSIMLDHTWKAADYAQALARTCRRGQAHECHHFDLIANRFQEMVVKKLRASTDFDASLAEWQHLKGILCQTSLTTS